MVSILTQKNFEEAIGTIGMECVFNVVVMAENVDTQTLRTNWINSIE